MPPILDDVVFHCQHAEKTLKGFLAWHDQVFRKTHNLEELGELCLHIDPTLRSLINRIVPLTEYAWKFRYLRASSLRPGAVPCGPRPTPA